MCQQQWEATSNPPPTAVSNAYNVIGGLNFT
jgi:hypothetical protein